MCVNLSQCFNTIFMLTGPCLKIEIISLFICHSRPRFFAVNVDGCLQRHIFWSTYFPRNQSVNDLKGRKVLTLFFIYIFNCLDQSFG